MIPISAMKIYISENLKSNIKHFVDQCETNRFDHILAELVEQGHIDEEFGYLDQKSDRLILDVIEKEIKSQLECKI